MIEYSYPIEPRSDELCLDRLRGDEHEPASRTGASQFLNRLRGDEQEPWGFLWESFFLNRLRGDEP